MARRTEHIKVRLVPSADGFATEVLLFKHEKAAIEQACAQLSAAQGITWGVSSFLREVGLWGCGDRSPARSYVERIAAAAEASGMGPGEWMRTLALAVVGYSPLGDQLARAREGLARGFPESS